MIRITFSITHLVKMDRNHTCIVLFENHMDFILLLLSMNNIVM